MIAFIIGFVIGALAAKVYDLLKEKGVVKK